MSDDQCTCKLERRSKPPTPTKDNDIIHHIQERTRTVEEKAGDADHLHYLLSKMLEAFEWRCARCGAVIDPLGGITSSTRIECFVGHVLGIKNIKNSKETGSRAVTMYGDKAENNIRYRYNDRFGDTRYLEFEQMASKLDSPSGFYKRQFLRLVRDAKSFLVSLLGRERVEDAYLQCNINVYKSADKMPFHRDDVKDGDGTNTFLPAAVTTILLHESLSKAGGAANAGFRLCLPDVNNKYASVSDGKASGDVIESAGERKLFGLSTDNYKYGVHAAVTGWDDESDGFHRASLNFRFVHPHVFRDFLNPQEG